jgi:hypothetical protein
LQQLVDALQAASEQARQRERAQRGFVDDGALGPAAASSPSHVSAAAAVPSPPLDAKGEERELAWTRARLDKLQSQLDSMTRLQLRGEASKRLFDFTMRSWQSWLDELWRNMPTNRDQAMAWMLPTFTHILRAPPEQHTHARSFPLADVLPKINAAHGAPQFLLSVGFVFVDHHLTLPAGTDLSSWPAVVTALHARSAEVASDRELARKRGLDTLVSKVAPAKAQKRQEGAAANSGPSAASAASTAASPSSPASSSLQSLQQELHAVEQSLQKSFTASGFGVPHLLDIQVLDWSAKDVDSRRRYESTPTMVDAAGRRWRAFVSKVAEGQLAFWIELVSKLHSEESVHVRAAFEAMHHSAHIPCFRPSLNAPLQVQSLEFRSAQPLLGFARFISEQELYTIGALSKATDKVSAANSTGARRGRKGRGLCSRALFLCLFHSMSAVPACRAEHPTVHRRPQG